MSWHSIIRVVSVIASSAAAQRTMQVQPAALRGLETRIIGGEWADFDEYPWFALGSGCGASLVAPEWVLTAAHCDEDSFKRVKIGAVCRGSNENYNCNTDYEWRKSKKQFVHPKNNAKNMSYDLRLVQLTIPSTVEPVQIDDDSLSYSYEGGQKGLWSVGFGVLKIDPRVRATYIMELEKGYVTSKDCKKEYKNSNPVDDSMLCAQNDEDKKSVCFGDSGGPLYDKNAKKLVGVVSWGSDDCKGSPAVYSRIATSYDWITETICEESVTKPAMCYKWNPSSEPSTSPSITSMPTVVPTSESSNNPSLGPTVVESMQPTVRASSSPSISSYPSSSPSASPSSGPSVKASPSPSTSSGPSSSPFANPSSGPSVKATSSPSNSSRPSSSPFGHPSPGPSVKASSSPSSSPSTSVRPSSSLSTNPSAVPSVKASASPSSSPSTSARPSSSPSVGSNAPTIQPSSTPTVSRTTWLSEEPPNDIPEKSFQIRTIYTNNGKNAWCLKPIASKSESKVVVEECDFSDFNQLWKMHNGQIRSAAEDTLCLEGELEDSDMIRIFPCSEDGESAFIFDFFQQSLLWVKSGADFKNDGFRAVSLSSVPVQSDVGSREARFREFFFGDIFQKWEPVYFN